jgi:hypothetical protein
LAYGAVQSEVIANRAKVRSRSGNPSIFFEQEDAMKALTKFLAGTVAAAALTVTAASPASAQWDRRDRGGIDTGDIIAGVAVLGGIAAIVAALDRDGNRYGYDNRYRYRNDYTSAVNACGYEAQRYGRGARVSITDIDRRSSGRSYRVRGVIDAGYDSFSRYSNDRYGRYGNYGSYGSYGRYGNAYGQRAEFACTARYDGRITDFDIDRL